MTNRDIKVQAESKELPAGASYIKDLDIDRFFTLEPYDNEPPESAIWCYSGFWEDDNSYWAYRWSSEHSETEFKPNTIVYPL